MWRRPTCRVRDIFMGVLIGLGVAGLLVRWHIHNDHDKRMHIDDDHDKRMLIKRFNDGEERSMHLVQWNLYLTNLYLTKSSI